jgi:DHA1 family multidrug resistance protein-like MFS transporter/DHA1 family quinolone resistance protein-like MFS transporter
MQSGETVPENKGSGRKLAVIGPLAVLAAMGQGTLNLGLVFHARDTLAASRAETGWLAGVWFLTYMVSCHVSQPLSRHLRPRFCVLGASLSQAVFCFLLAHCQTLAPAFVLNGLLGVATAFFWPPMMGWLAANAEGTRLSRRLGIFNLCWSGGAILSPMLAGRAADLSTRLPLLLSTGLFFLASLVVAGAIWWMPGIQADDDAHERERDPAGPVASGTPLRYPAWVGLVAAYAVAGVLRNVFPMVARGELGLSPGQVGDLLFWCSFATSAALGCLGRQKWWHFRGWQMVGGSAIMGLAMIGLALAGPRMERLIPVLVVAGGALGVNYVNSIFHGAAGSSHRAARMAIHESLLSAGAFFGASLGGMVYQGAGSTSLLLGCAGVLGLAALVQFRLVRRCAEA